MGVTQRNIFIYMAVFFWLLSEKYLADPSSFHFGLTNYTIQRGGFYERN
jgi:hypothetical protein